MIRASADSVLEKYEHSVGSEWQKKKNSFRCTVIVGEPINQLIEILRQHIPVLRILPQRP